MPPPGLRDCACSRAVDSDVAVPEVEDRSPPSQRHGQQLAHRITARGGQGGSDGQLVLGWGGAHRRSTAGSAELHTLGTASRGP